MQLLVRHSIAYRFMNRGKPFRPEPPKGFKDPFLLVNSHPALADDSLVIEFTSSFKKSTQMLDHGRRLDLQLRPDLFNRSPIEKKFGDFSRAGAG
jgi:hypothetical protein